MLSQIKLGYKIAATNLGFSMPYQLNFAITYWCNSRCTFCKIWELRPENELTLEEIEKFVKKIPFIQWVRLTGGEPTLRKDYVDIVRAFDKLPLYVLTTPTNSIMPDDIYKKISQVLEFFDKKYVVTVSLDGDEQTHDRVRGITGNWDRAIRLYQKLRALKNDHKNFNVFFGYTMYPENVGIFPKMFSDIKQIIPEITVNDFHVNIYQTSETYFHTAGTQLPDGYAAKAIKEIESVLELREKKGIIGTIENRYLKMGIQYLQQGKTPLPCNIMDMSCFVDPWGNVFPCIIFNEKVGNLREADYDLRKILQSEKTRITKEKTEKLQCPNCWTPCEAHQLILSNWMKSGSVSEKNKIMAASVAE